MSNKQFKIVHFINFSFSINIKRIKKKKKFNKTNSWPLFKH